MPDGYSSNLARCADANTGKLHALKVDDVIKLDQNIPVILCKLEQVFPPGFFDSMEHLPVHLAYEDYLGGPVQYRWMYPFERFMGDSKRSVKNKARVEGSICAHYLHRETSHFCSHYFKHLMLTPRIIRNPVNVSERSQFTLSVFGLPGRPSGKKGVHWLTQQEMQSAHVHVLINCVEVKPFLEEFNNTYFHTTGVQSTSGVIHAQFPAWFKERMYSIVAPTPEILHLRNLSQGPIQSANEWHTYFVNGYKFHTHTWTEGKKTINSGVFVKGVTDGGEDDFYGFVKHIYELVLSDTMVEGHLVDSFILDEEHEDIASEDNITSNDENDVDDEHEDLE
ncbi:uncharacterized protein LOC131634776 [Vicia villosa]|uniref:uncharacterized protein LOC131634776 n=1 Tax=Vicia villosa TaxID=3911 RepID=UPI00273B37F1|nr:uncharacterized protein LOC131634776 [Vicia villosa]